jgi:hypothetical protein
MLDWVYKPFDQKISYKKLTGIWLFFFITGIGIKTLLTPLSPSFIETEENIVSTFCTPWNMLEVGVAFLTETMIFFLLPYKLKGKKGAMVGIIAWIGLHLLSKDIPIAIYISLMGYFYYRCLEIGRWKAIMVFHFIPNFLGLLSCI